MAALGLGCAVFLFATWDRGEADDQKAAADQPARQVVPFEPARRDTEPPLLTDQPLDPEAPILTSSDEQVPALETSPSSSSNGPSAAERRQTLIDEARRSPVLAYSRQGSGVAPTGGLAAAGVAPGTTAPIQARVTPLDGLRQTSPVSEARAGQLGDRNLLLTAGASIPCIL